MLVAANSMLPVVRAARGGGEEIVKRAKTGMPRVSIEKCGVGMAHVVRITHDLILIWWRAVLYSDSLFAL